MSDRERRLWRTMRLSCLYGAYGTHVQRKGGLKMTDCEKCKYSYEHNCEKRKSQDRPPCDGCEMYDEDASLCRCCLILAHERDCPYFVECEDMRDEDRH